MREDEIDQVLASQFAEIEPSSGFALSVMRAVRAEAAAPPPIPFPWRRAVPGIAGAAVAVAWGLAEFVRLALSAAPASLPGLALPVGVDSAAGVVASILAGTLVAVAASALSMKIVSNKAA